MSLLVVGSVAFDAVETPFGKRDKTLGGSALYFSTSASNFTKVRLCAVVGHDYPEEPVTFLQGRGVDTSGLERDASGKTFFWSGKYDFNLNNCQTLDTQLNVFQHFKPQIPESFRDSEYVFLANIDPVLQLSVLEQVKKPKLVALDTMNFWIQGKREELLKVLAKVDLLLINDSEARMLSGEFNLVKAARKIRAMGPKHLVLKQGEYGALLFTENEMFRAPAYPLESVFDPTGAGDTFAGGVIGYLASRGAGPDDLKKAVIAGTVLASFVVEDFSIDRMRKLTQKEIGERFTAIHRLTHFEDKLVLPNEQPR